MRFDTGVKASKRVSGRRWKKARCEDMFVSRRKTDANGVRNKYDRGVGAEAFVRRSPAGRRGLRTGEFWAVAILTGFAMILAWFLVAADLRSDLSDLRPSRKMTDPATILIGWPDLASPQHIERASPPPGIRVQMLGYMMEGYVPRPEVKEVETFVLMPDAGQILRPARRNPREMVQVLLRGHTRFRNRELVWVSGVIERGDCTSGDSAIVSYCMKDGDVWPAEQREITRWFTP